MKPSKVKISFSIAAVCSAFIFLFAFRSIPVFRIWDSYKVVYADKSIPEEKVLSCLENSGCQNIISLGRQKIPLVLDFTPVLPDSYNEYLTSRLGYFFDYSKSFLLYYIPTGSGQQILKALENLSQETGLQAGIDGIQQYPFAVPVVCIIVFLAFAYLSKNKVPFFFSSCFSLLLSFSKPFYPVAAAAVLYMLSCYLAQRIWGRKKAFSVLKKNPYFIIPLAVSFLIALLSGAQEGFLMILCGIASCSALFLLGTFEAFMDSRNSFKTVKIFSAPQLPLMYPATAFHTLLCLAPLLVLLFCFIFASNFSFTSGKNVSLPVPVESSSESSIPSLKDFYRWAWNVESFPYKNLNRNSGFENVQEGSVVSVPRFEEKNGRIFQVDSIVMKFSSDFKNHIDKKVESLGYNAIEKLMLKQGENTSVAYSSKENVSRRPDGFSASLILSCLFVPVFLLLLYVIKSNRRRSL